MALVLKTSDAERHRGFESLSLRHFQKHPGLEKYPSGRRGSPAKGVDRDNRCEGSNPSFSALKALAHKRFKAFFVLSYTLKYTIYNIIPSASEPLI